MTTHTNTTSGIDPGAFAVQFIEKRAAAYADENASTEPDTGATSWHYGEAGRDYYNTLVELADDIREALARRAGQTATGTGATHEQLSTNPDTLSTNQAALSGNLDAGTGDADEQIVSSEDLQDVLSASAADDISDGLFTGLFATPAAAQPIYQVQPYQSGWCDVSRDEYESHTPSQWRKKRIVYATPDAAQPDDARNAAQSDNALARMERAEWSAVSNALRDARAALCKGGVRHTWLDGAVTLAEERAKGIGTYAAGQDGAA